MKLGWYVTRRIAVGLILLLVISLFVFSLLYITPGSPALTLLGGRPATPQLLSEIQDKYHLNHSFIVQYLDWLKNAVQLNFGTSIVSDQPVTTAIREQAGPTFALAIAGLLLTVVVGVPAGMYAAAKRGTAADRATSMLTLLGMSAPSFAVGVLLLEVFAVTLGWFPVIGNGSGLLGGVQHLVLPAISLAIAQIAYVARQTRAAAWKTYEQDYVTFARARGLGRFTIWRRYVLLNSSLPIVTASGLLLAYSLAGVVLIETTFSRQGLGELTLQAVEGKDIPVVQGLVAFAAIAVVIVNLGVDLINLAIDPRLRRALG